MYVLVDIDHTLSDAFWRDKMIGLYPWDDYHSQSKHDKPFPHMIELINTLANAGDSVVCITGRNEKFRGLTVNWLVNNKARVADILMRPDDDFTKNGEMKVNLIKRYFQGYYGAIKFLIDDNEETILAFNKLGITTLQVRNINGGQMNKNTTDAINFASEASKVLKQRGELYATDDIELHAHTKIMQLLYPKGVPCDFDAMTQYKYVSQIVDKIVRYRINRQPDNLLDSANYTFLLMAYDKDRVDDEIRPQKRESTIRRYESTVSGPIGLAAVEEALRS